MTTESAGPAEPVSSAETKQRIRYGWPSIAIAAVAGLLYAYVLWGAVGDLVSLPSTLGSLTPWWLLILAAAAPVIAWVVAFILGRRASFGARGLYFLIGLTVVACSTVGSIAYIQTHFVLL